MNAGCACCDIDPLAIACESLVIRALELVGKRAVRANRSHWRELGTSMPWWHTVHIRMTPSQRDIDAALEHAWVLVPELCTRWGHNDHARVTKVLDDYTRRLITTRDVPALNELRRLLDDRARVTHGISSHR